MGSVSVSRALEIERKYAVPEGATIPDLGTLEGVVSAEPRPALRLEATYVDTDDRALLAAGIAVRRRTGGHDDGWHVKLRGARGRMELHAPIDPAAPDDLPAEFERALRTRLRGRPVGPVAIVRTERRAVVVTDGEGGGVEVVDDRVLATDVQAGVLRSWREWEAEQAEDSGACAALLDRVDAALRSAGAVDSASPAKIAQALGLEERPPERQPPSTAGEVLASRLAVHTEALHDGIRSLVLEGDDGGERVHELRKSIRRARSLLALRSVAGTAAEPVRDGLGELGRRLGAVRDPLVAARTVRGLLDAVERDVPGREDATALLVTAPLAEQAALTARLTEDLLGSQEVLRLLAALEGFVPGGPHATATADAVLPRLGERTVRRARRRARRSEGGGLDALHRARKAAKRARFVVEELAAAGSPLPGRTLRAGRRARALQDLLGAHRDLALVLDSLGPTSERLTSSGGNAFALGRAAEDGRRRLALLQLRVERSARRLR